MRWELIFLGIFFLFSSSNALQQYNVQLQFTFLDKDGFNIYNDLQFDPSRNTLQVINNNTEVGRYYPNPEGIYSMVLPHSNTPFKLHFYSKDLMFMSTSMFQLDISDDVLMTSINIGSRILGTPHGISVSVDNPNHFIDINLNGPLLGVEISNWGLQTGSAGVQSQSLFESIPYLSTIVGNKLLWIPIAAVFLLALLPQLIALLDPSFKDRIVAAQMEAKKDT